MTVGEIIKETRTQRGLTQIELAQKAGVSPSSITRIENDKETNRRILARVCLALDTDLKSVEVQAEK